jgi:hypothetical protein
VDAGESAVGDVRGQALHLLAEGREVLGDEGGDDRRRSMSAVEGDGRLGITGVRRPTATVAVDVDVAGGDQDVTEVEVGRADGRVVRANGGDGQPVDAHVTGRQHLMPGVDPGGCDEHQSPARYRCQAGLLSYVKR